MSGEPDYLQDSNDWFLSEEAKAAFLKTHDVSDPPPPSSGKVWLCLTCRTAFWTSRKRREHRSHPVAFGHLEKETLALLRGEPSKHKMIFGNLES